MATSMEGIPATRDQNKIESNIGPVISAEPKSNVKQPDNMVCKLEELDERPLSKGARYWLWLTRLLCCCRCYCCGGRDVNWKRVRGWGCCEPFRHSAPLVLRLPIKSVDTAIDDSSSFAFAMLKEDIASFILERAWDEATGKQPLHLVFMSLDKDDMKRTRELSLVVANTFLHQSTTAQYEVVRSCSDGVSALFISLFVLIIILAVLIPINIAYGHSTAPGWLILVNSIAIILNWVIIWHPAEELLYGRYTLQRKQNIAKRLARAVTKVEFLDSCEAVVKAEKDVYDHEDEFEHGVRIAFERIAKDGDDVVKDVEV